MPMADPFFSSKTFVVIHRLGWLGASGLFGLGFSAPWLIPHVAHDLTRWMEVSGLIVTGFMLTVDIVWTFFETA
ncbi:MAG: hypothetical protein ACYCOU_24550 [Sulfobacillus sp.]